MNDRLLLSVTIFIYLILVLHGIALHYYLYWTMWWYDIMMHFLGGVWVGLFAVWLWFRSGYFRQSAETPRSLLRVTIISVLGIGLLWEVYEYLYHIVFALEFQPHYLEDTQLDLVLDIAGGCAAWLLLQLPLFRNQEPQPITPPEGGV